MAFGPEALAREADQHLMSAASALATLARSIQPCTVGKEAGDLVHQIEELQQIVHGYAPRIRQVARQIHDAGYTGTNFPPTDMFFDEADQKKHKGEPR